MNSNNQAILIFSIDLGKGREETITVREKDTPRDLARTFSRKHKLDKDLEEILTVKISQYIDELLIIEEFNEYDYKISEELHEDSEADEEISENSKVHLSIPKQTKLLSQLHAKYDNVQENNKAMKKPVNGKQKKQKSVRYIRMHEESIKRKQTKERLSEERKRQKYIEDMKESTFHPKINHYKQRSIDCNIKPQERLFKQANSIQRKIMKTKFEQTVKFKKSFTFKPRTNQQFILSLIE